VVTLNVNLGLTIGGNTFNISVKTHIRDPLYSC